MKETIRKEDYYCDICGSFIGRGKLAIHKKHRIILQQYEREGHFQPGFNTTTYAHVCDTCMDEIHTLIVKQSKNKKHIKRPKPAKPLPEGKALNEGYISTSLASDDLKKVKNWLKRTFLD